MDKYLNKIIQGDCIEVMKTLPENSVDSIVSDPPYELGFMGKSWDNTGIANNKDMWAECLRVLKPGGHLLAFSGTRTYHRMACAIEDAGFEVRDMVEWCYGSGFPKSLNIGKAVDKLQGNEREEFNPGGRYNYSFQEGNSQFVSETATKSGKRISLLPTKDTSEWEGWGTALKPAHEPICMARKPLAEKTVAENVLKYGTGGINIDESRVDCEDNLGRNNHKNPYGSERTFSGSKTPPQNNTENPPSKRFPANLIHDNSPEVRECFPETKTNSTGKNSPADYQTKSVFGAGYKSGALPYGGDSGSASRFFKSIIYTAKASKSERNMGYGGLESQDLVRQGLAGEHNNPKHQNNHPTVKPIALMEYLIKMVTPKGGIVLDPFAGSGSTCVAAKNNNFNFIGIEREKDYVQICNARLSAVPNDLFNYQPLITSSM